jgi:hypothetical protein
MAAFLREEVYRHDGINYILPSSRGRIRTTSRKRAGDVERAA